MVFFCFSFCYTPILTVTVWSEAPPLALSTSNARPPTLSGHMSVFMGVVCWLVVLILRSLRLTPLFTGKFLNMSLYMTVLGVFQFLHGRITHSLSFPPQASCRSLLYEG